LKKLSVKKGYREAPDQFKLRSPILSDHQFMLDEYAKTIN